MSVESPKRSVRTSQARSTSPVISSWVEIPASSMASSKVISGGIRERWVSKSAQWPGRQARAKARNRLGRPQCIRCPGLPGKLTFWRRRITAILLVAGVAAALWVALADGTPKRESRADKLSVTELAGQRLVTGFSGGSPPQRVKRMIGEGKLAGVVLFSENLGSNHHARRLIRKLQAIKRPRHLHSPLLVMIDQEGGLVKRLPGPPNASAEEMGKRGKAYSRRQGAKTGKSLAGVGVNVNLAPVLDVGRRGSFIRAEHRSFGGKPGRVIDTAVP